MRLAALAGVLALFVTAGPASSNTIAGKPWLGIVMSNGGKYGVKISAVYRGAPADLAGVESGDEVLSIDSHRIRSMKTLKELVQDDRAIGDEVEVKLLRDGRTLTVTAVLGRGPSDDDILRLRLLDQPAPDLELPSVQGKSSAPLARYQGNVVVVAFVSARCGACPGALEGLSELAKQRGGEGLRVLAVSGSGGTRYLRTLNGEPASLKLLRDRRGNEVRKAWLGLNPELPVMAVIDRDGVVRWVGKDLDAMRAPLARALRERNGVAIE